MSHAYVCIQISKVCNFVVFTVNMLQNFYPRNFGGKDTKIHIYEWLHMLGIRARMTLPTAATQVVSKVITALLWLTTLFKIHCVCPQ